jgi:hypothetical protein
MYYLCINFINVGYPYMEERGASQLIKSGFSEILNLSTNCWAQMAVVYVPELTGREQLNGSVQR